MVHERKQARVRRVRQHEPLNSVVVVQKPLLSFPDCQKVAALGQTEAP